MATIDKDFVISRYGISVRLVEEEDAEFIVKLRTDERLSRFLHYTDSSVEKQIEWIRQYKERERANKEYYFLYYSNQNKIGVSRVYNIFNKKEATNGSWICSPENKMEQSIATIILARDIFFENLGFYTEHFQVSKGNNHVLKFHLGMGAQIVFEDNDEYQLLLEKCNYYSNRDKMIKFLNL